MFPKNRGIPKWMDYNGKPYEQMDDLGVPLFLETPIFEVLQFLLWQTLGFPHPPLWFPHSERRSIDSNKIHGGKQHRPQPKNHAPVVRSFCCHRFTKIFVSEAIVGRLGQPDGDTFVKQTMLFFSVFVLFVGQMGKDL